jgi:hypothetical protein
MNMPQPSFTLVHTLKRSQKFATASSTQATAEIIRMTNTEISHITDALSPPKPVRYSRN